MRPSVGLYLTDTVSGEAEIENVREHLGLTLRDLLGFLLAKVVGGWNPPLRGEDRLGGPGVRRRAGRLTCEQWRDQTTIRSSIETTASAC